MQNEVEQAIRRSHCSNTGKEHACVGICTITPNGIALSCVKCGKDDNPNRPPANGWVEDRAAAILHAAGMRFASLSEEAKHAVVQEIGRDACPNCRALKFHTTPYDDYYRCECGWSWSKARGWKINANILPPVSPIPAD